MQLPIEYLISATILASLLLLSLTLYYLYSFHKKESELNVSQESTDKYAQDLLLQAQAKAQTIVEQATNRANHLLLEAGATQDQIQSLLDKAISQLLTQYQHRLDATMERFEQNQKNTYEGVHAAYQEQIGKTVDEIRESTQKELTDFMQTLQKETIEAQRAIGATLNSQLQDIQKELVTYKRDQLQRTNEAISKTILEIAEKTLGKTIRIKDHEKLVIEALSEAKEKGVLTNG